MDSLPDGYVRFIKGKCSVWRGRLLKGLKQSPSSANLEICEPRPRGDSHPFLSLIFHPTVQLIPSHVKALQVHAKWRAAAVSLPLTETAAPSLLPPFRVGGRVRLTLVTLSVKWTLTFLSAQTRLNKRWWAINLVLHLFQFPASLSLLTWTQGDHPFPGNTPTKWHHMSSYVTHVKFVEIVISHQGIEDTGPDAN